LLFRTSDPERLNVLPNPALERKRNSALLQKLRDALLGTLGGMENMKNSTYKSDTKLCDVLGNLMAAVRDKLEEVDSICT